MFKKNKITVVFDVIFLYLSLHFITIYIGLGTEEFFKKLIVVALTIFFMESLGFYKRKGLPRHELLFSIGVLIALVIISSILVTYAVYFVVLGRKVYIAYFIILFCYLIIRNRVFLLYPDDSKIFVYGCEDEFEKLNISYMIFNENTNPRLDDIVVIGQNKIDDNLSRALIHYKLMGGNVLKFTDFYERQFLKIPLDYFKSTLDIIMLDGFNRIKRKEQIILKRLLDVVLSTLLLIVLSPILIITAIFIKLDSKGPVFYRQMRTGEGGRAFTIYKFRSMFVDAEKMGAKWAEKDDPRITKVGRFIRKTRIDELPQLINILKGEMSFVGPRPERPEFDKKLSKEIPFWMLRYLAKPGLTGWAQINYNYGASIEDAKEKLTFDMYYIKNFSFYLDLKIIVNTLKVIFFGKGR